MTPQAATSVSPQAAGDKSATEVRYVARQPILDRMGRVHGYELRARSEPDEHGQANQDLAICTMLDNVVVYGLQQLTGGVPAFVRCTGGALTRRLVEVLPPSMTVLELVEPMQRSTELVSTCQLLKSEGFRLALGSYAWESGYEPLVELADYIKVDFTLLCASGRHYLQRRANHVAAALVAENVETQEDYRQACAEGFTLFQGYYFCRPVLLKQRKVPTNHLSQIRILQLLHSDPVDLHAVSQAVKRDLSLTYRLLRLVNSPVCAIRQEVRSIEAALMVVGEEMFQRMATLAIASELNTNQSTEVLRMAFVRGRFCEKTGAENGLEPTEQYLLGLLSLLPAMLNVGMEELLPVLPLRASIREALEGSKNPERQLLDWLEAHERGDWRACDATVAAHGLNREQLDRQYAAAVEWAEGALHMVL
jgi:EAL and modified HD-GYP domain-containing signal transduction protein